MNEDKEQNKKALRPDILKWIITCLAAFVIVMLIFGAGMFMGGMKAKFSYRWAESYHKNFAGPRNGMLRGAFKDFGGKDLIDSHGAAGQILKIDPSTGSGQAELVIQGQDGVEKIIVVKDGVAVRRLREATGLSELKVNDYITVIGSPTDDGKIEAKFIRVMP